MIGISSGKLPILYVKAARFNQYKNYLGHYMRAAFSGYPLPKSYPIQHILALLLLLFVSNAGTASAQAINDGEPQTSEEWEQRSYFRTGLSYLSNYVYLGRKDTALLPYFGPTISYHNQNGFTLEANGNFTNSGNDTRLDMFSLEGDYDHRFSDQWRAGGYAGWLHFNKSSTNARAAANAYLGAYLAFYNDFISPQIQLTSIFGKQTDYITSFSLEHEFGINQNRLTITPTIKCNAGTQNYYSTSVGERLNKRGKLVTKNTVTGDSQFGILDYELSMPIEWNIHRWLIAVNPTFFIPLNPVSTTEGSTTVTEKLDNSFNIQVSLNYRFLVCKHT